MDCKTVTEKLSQLIDSEISEEEALEIRDHLKTCSECEGVYEGLLKLKESLREIKREEAPPSFMENLKQALKKEEKRGLLLRLPVRGRGLSVVAAMLIVGFMGIYYLADINNQDMGTEAGGDLGVKSFENANLQRSADEGEKNRDLDEETVYYIDKLKEDLGEDITILETARNEDGTIVIRVLIDGTDATYNGKDGELWRTD